MGHNPTGNPARHSQQQGQEFIAQVHRKMSKLVQDFAQGEINRTQFHQLYDRYQRQITAVAQLIAESGPASWRDAIRETEDTLNIKKRLTAKAIGLSVVDNQNGRPIETVGDFAIDADRIAPMLSSYRAAAAGTFRAGMRSAELENGQWLCFMPGSHTTLIALFSLEPSDSQLQTIERMHQDFEQANRAALETGQIDPQKLVYPFYAIVDGRIDPAK